MKWYQFTLFLLYLGKIAEKNGYNTNGGRKLLLEECKPSLHNSMFKIGGYRKYIQKHSMKTMIPIYIVSVMCWKNSGQKKRLYHGLKKKYNYYWKNTDHHYCTHQPNKTKCNNGQQTYKVTVSLYSMISYDRWKGSKHIKTHIFILVYEKN